MLSKIGLAFYYSLAGIGLIMLAFVVVFGGVFALPGIVAQVARHLGASGDAVAGLMVGTFVLIFLFFIVVLPTFIALFVKDWGVSALNEAGILNDYPERETDKRIDPTFGDSNG